ncbi:hypothetical protein WMF27_05085 [Sorangium sp. So ce281]|uniref:hypothetical protein n=1 Tax=unclassified Sorangium TaxID=2621164 RepID=UPI003F5EAC7B
MSTQMNRREASLDPEIGIHIEQYRGPAPALLTRRSGGDLPAIRCRAWPRTDRTSLASKNASENNRVISFRFALGVVMRTGTFALGIELGSDPARPALPTPAGRAGLIDRALDAESAVRSFMELPASRRGGLLMLENEGRKSLMVNR